MVPKTGMPKRARLDRRRGVEAGEVAGARGEQAGLGAVRAAQPEVDEAGCRRASRQRAALLAIIVWKLSRLRARLSTSCASGSGAVTRRIGSSAKNTRAFGHRIHVAGEAQPGQPSQRLRRKRPVASSQSQFVGVEVQRLEELERLLEAGGDQEIALRRQARTKSSKTASLHAERAGTRSPS